MSAHICKPTATAPTQSSWGPLTAHGWWVPRPVRRWEDHGEFAAAFDRQDIDLKDIFYCAESVLLADYRGQGVGHSFFDLREAHGRDLGRRYSAFCGVVRPPDHPLRPADYAPLDPFWRKRGYMPVEGAVAQYRWKDIDQQGESDHDLQFWMRAL